jgi:hypothetical protein
VIGETVTFTATVAPTTPGGPTPTGTVIFFDTDTGLQIGSNSLSGGTASIQVNNLALGEHDVEARYQGGPGYATSTGVVREDVDPAGTQVGLNSSPNPSVVGNDATFTATLSVAAPGSAANVAPAGDVTFVDITTGATLGVVPLANGQAVLTTNALTVGGHTIGATFTSTSANFNSSAQTTIVHNVVNPLVFQTLPGSVRSGTGFSVIVHYLNNGVPDPGFDGQITIALANNPAGGVLGGLLTVSAEDGVAIFNGLHINRAANGYTLQVTSPGVPALVSSPLNVTASQLLGVALPARPFSNEPFRIRLTAVDVTGAVATNFNGAFVAKVRRKPAGSKVTGRLNGNFVAGGAQLRNLRVDTAGRYVFRVNYGGLLVDVVVNARGRRLS